MPTRLFRQGWAEFTATGTPRPLWRIGSQSALATAIALAAALSGPTELLGFGLAGAFGASYGGNLRGRQRIAVVASMAIALPLLALATTGIHTLTGGGQTAEYCWMLVVVASGLVILPAVGIGPPGVMFLIVTTSIGWARDESAGVGATLAIALVGCVGTIAVVTALELRGSTDTFDRGPARVKPTFDMHKFAQFSAIAIAGLLCLIISLGRVDWAMLTASIMLTRGYQLHVSAARGLHRILGTGVGLALFGVLAALHLSPWAYLPILATVQFWIESTIAWRYAVAVAGITPLVLSISMLTTDSPAPIEIRVIETALGIAAALAVAAAARALPDRVHQPP